MPVLTLIFLLLLLSSIPLFFLAKGILKTTHAVAEESIVYIIEALLAVIAFLYLFALINLVIKGALWG